MVAFAGVSGAVTDPTACGAWPTEAGCVLPQSAKKISWGDPSSSEETISGGVPSGSGPEDDESETDQSPLVLSKSARRRTRRRRQRDAQRAAARGVATPAALTVASAALAGNGVRGEKPADSRIDALRPRPLATVTLCDLGINVGGLWGSPADKSPLARLSGQTALQQPPATSRKPTSTASVASTVSPVSPASPASPASPVSPASPLSPWCNPGHAVRNLAPARRENNAACQGEVSSAAVLSQLHSCSTPGNYWRTSGDNCHRMAESCSARSLNAASVVTASAQTVQMHQIDLAALMPTRATPQLQECRSAPYSPAGGGLGIVSTSPCSSSGRISPSTSRAGTFGEASCRAPPMPWSCAALVAGGSAVGGRPQMPTPSAQRAAVGSAGVNCMSGGFASAGADMYVMPSPAPTSAGETLRLLMGRAGLTTASKDLAARLQAAVPEVYED
eukprot:TRINITY_DN17093_c0_g1_i2.p1 TRINITY_DN17093_c0_g1~~TRINITY_DN17093_c0_g1_i2.p1  ORF type:complete len:448 (+),score=89.71 TRINITY_DN17093_c0_g1_i2:194-1537(+)